MKDENTNIYQRLKKRRFSSIFIKNLFLLSIVIVLPMVIVVWIASFSFNTFTDNEILVYSNKSLAMLKNVTDNMLSDCHKQMNYIAAENDTTVFLMSKGDEDSSFYDQKIMFKQLAVQMRTKDYLENIYIYSERNNLIFSNYGLTDLKDFFDNAWYNEYAENQQPGRFWCSFRNTRSAFQFTTQILSLYKDLGYLKERRGVLVFNINFDKFVTELSSLRSSYDDGLFIADSEFNILADVWGNHDDISIQGFQSLLHSAEDYVKSDDYVLYKAPIKYTDWYYISAVPYEIYQANINVLWKDMFLVIGFGFAITVFITILISIRIYQPYKKILKVIEYPVSLLKDEQELGPNEETYILNTIKHTMSENTIITQELKERVALLRKAQSLALQAQINPHFLFNTLDTINWSAMRLTGGKNETSSMISNLASMIRYSLESVDSMVPLEKELENIRTYLNLQEIRYRNKFSVVWEIDDATRNCKVIKIMLQPLLENAIYHGIKPLSGNGTIWIKAKKVEETLKIVIEDNGIGMGSQAIKRINEMMKDKKIQEKEHIGIMNVNQRIQLFFGDQYGITVASEETQGTAIILILPYEV